MLYILVTRVADDHYFIYGSLSSGQNNLFITNDKLGDHIERVKRVDKSLALVFQKWLRSTRVTYTHGVHPYWKGLEVQDNGSPQNESFSFYYRYHVLMTLCYSGLMMTAGTYQPVMGTGTVSRGSLMRS